MTTMSNSAVDQLNRLVGEIEDVEKQKSVLSDTLKAVYADAKAEGFDVKILRKVIAIRKKSDADRREEEQLLSLYLSSIE